MNTYEYKKLLDDLVAARTLLEASGSESPDTRRGLLRFVQLAAETLRKTHEKDDYALGFPAGRDLLTIDYLASQPMPEVVGEEEKRWKIQMDFLSDLVEQVMKNAKVTKE